MSFGGGSRRPSAMGLRYEDHHNNQHHDNDNGDGDVNNSMLFRQTLSNASSRNQLGGGGGGNPPSSSRQHQQYNAIKADFALEEPVVSGYDDTFMTAATNNGRSNADDGLAGGNAAEAADHHRQQRERMKTDAVDLAYERMLSGIGSGAGSSYEAGGLVKSTTSTPHDGSPLQRRHQQYGHHDGDNHNEANISTPTASASSTRPSAAAAAVANEPAAADDSLFAGHRDDTNPNANSDHGIKWRGEVLKIGVKHNSASSSSAAAATPPPPTAKTHPREVIVADDGNLYLCLPAGTAAGGGGGNSPAIGGGQQFGGTIGGVTRTIGLLGIDEVVVYEPYSSSAADGGSYYSLPDGFLEAVGRAAASPSPTDAAGQFLLDLVAEYFPDDWVCKIVVGNAAAATGESSSSSPNAAPLRESSNAAPLPRESSNAAPLPLWLLFPSAAEGEAFVETMYNDVLAITSSFEAAVRDVGEAMAVQAANLDDLFVRLIKKRIAAGNLSVKITERLTAEEFARMNQPPAKMTAAGSGAVGTRPAAPISNNSAQRFGRTSSIPRGSSLSGNGGGATADFGSASPPHQTQYGLATTSPRHQHTNRTGSSSALGSDVNQQPITPFSGAMSALMGGSGGGGGIGGASMSSSKPQPSIPRDQQEEDDAYHNGNHYRVAAADGSSQQRPPPSMLRGDSRTSQQSFANPPPAAASSTVAALQDQLAALQRELLDVKTQQLDALETQHRREEQWGQHLRQQEERYEQALAMARNAGNHHHHGGGGGVGTVGNRTATGTPLPHQNHYEQHQLGAGVVVAPPIPNPIQDDSYLKQLANNASQPQMAVVANLLQASQKRLIECESEIESLKAINADNKRENRRLHDEIHDLQNGVLDRQRQEYARLKESKEEELAAVRTAFQEYDAQVQDHLAEVKKKHDAEVAGLKQRLDNSKRRSQHLRFHLQRLEGAVDANDAVYRDGLASALGGGPLDEDDEEDYYYDDAGGKGTAAARGMLKTPLAKYRMQILGGGGGVGGSRPSSPTQPQGGGGSANNAAALNPNANLDELTRSFVDAIRNTPTKATSSILNLPSAMATITAGGGGGGGGLSNTNATEVAATADKNSQSVLRQSLLSHVGGSNKSSPTRNNVNFAVSNPSGNASNNKVLSSSASANNKTNTNTATEDTAVHNLLTKLEQFIDLRANTAVAQQRQREDQIRFDHLQTIALEERRKADVEKSIAVHRRAKTERAIQRRADEAQLKRQQEEILAAMREQCDDDETVFEEEDEDRDADFEERYGRPKTVFIIRKRPPANRPVRRLRTTGWDADDAPEYYDDDDNDGNGGDAFGDRFSSTVTSQTDRNGTPATAANSRVQSSKRLGSSVTAGGGRPPLRGSSVSASTTSASLATANTHQRHPSAHQHRQQQRYVSDAEYEAEAGEDTMSRGAVRAAAFHGADRSDHHHRRAGSPALTTGARNTTPSRRAAAATAAVGGSNTSSRATTPIRRGGAGAGVIASYQQAAVAKAHQSVASAAAAAAAAANNGSNRPISPSASRRLRASSVASNSADDDYHRNGRVFPPPTLATPAVNEASPRRGPRLGEASTTRDSAAIRVPVKFPTSAAAAAANNGPNHLVSSRHGTPISRRNSGAAATTTQQDGPPPSASAFAPAAARPRNPNATSSAQQQRTSSPTPAGRSLVGGMSLHHDAAHLSAMNKISTDAAIARGGVGRDRRIL